MTHEELRSRIIEALDRCQIIDVNIARDVFEVPTPGHFRRFEPGTGLTITIRVEPRDQRVLT